MTDAEFKARLVYFRLLIDSALSGQHVVPEGYLEQEVRRLGTAFNLTDYEITKFVKHLETIYGTTQKNGHILKTTFVDWYPSAKKNIDFHYWTRLKTFWMESNTLPREVVTSVDTVTDEIMGFLGNPKDKESWNRIRGLVMGHVQMGKTTNYSALISKAADSGYRIIIVLAGLTNSLRYQTQVRLDKTFVGKSSVSDAAHTQIYDVAHVMKTHKDGYVPRFPFCGTTQLSDFNTATAGAVGAHQGTFAEPILFVTKKNAKVLEKITDWLKGLNNGAQLDGPMLVIDDEADNASVNTNANPNQIAVINSRIRMLLGTCKQSAYIGYTATPFANIFIDPESASDLLNEDLFPANFIKSLDPPSNYVGSSRLFTDDGDLFAACVRPIPKDYTNSLPLKHKSNHVLSGGLPESLKDAIREYLLFRAIRIIEGNGSAHSSMLINVSRFNHVQQQVKDSVDDFLKVLNDAIKTWACVDWHQSTVISDLHKVWVNEYQHAVNSSISWELVLEKLLDAISSIEPRLVNMRGVGIDYERAPVGGGGLHIIAIGGLALARGLTLEGLAVSYVLRNVGAADTLLQMGRWFGYRPGFERLCRVHATQDLIDDFSAISESVEELRTDFQRMALLNKTPYDFGLKVRQSPTGIAITAANKMRSATPISLAEDFSTKHVQAYSLHDDKKINQANIKVVINCINDLNNNYLSHYKNSTDTKSKALVWGKVPGKIVIDLIKDIQFPQMEFDLMTDDKNSLITSYIEDRLGAELSEWDIAIPYVSNSKSNSLKFPSEINGDFYCRTRGGTDRVSDTVVKVNKRNAIAFGVDDFYLGEDINEYEKRVTLVKKNALNEFEDNQDKKISETWARSVARSRPLLLVHFLQLVPDDGFKMNLPTDEPVVSIGILLPGTRVKCKERKYQASRRLIEMMQRQREESESDEALDNE